MKFVIASVLLKNEWDLLRIDEQHINEGIRDVKSLLDRDDIDHIDNLVLEGYEEDLKWVKKKIKVVEKNIARLTDLQKQEQEGLQFQR